MILFFLAYIICTCNVRLSFLEGEKQYCTFDRSVPVTSPAPFSRLGRFAGVLVEVESVACPRQRKSSRTLLSAHGPLRLDGTPPSRSFPLSPTNLQALVRTNQPGISKEPMYPRPTLLKSRPARPPASHYLRRQHLTPKRGDIRRLDNSLFCPSAFSQRHLCSLGSSRAIHLSFPSPVLAKADLGI